MRNKIIFVDDGGKPSDYQLIRTMDTDFSKNNDENSIKLKSIHKDLEAATRVGDDFIITTSLSKAGDKAYNLTTRFKYDFSLRKVTEETSIDLRKALLKEMGRNFQQAWFRRIVKAESKNGGLNIEGLSYNPAHSNSIILGLRSPLFHRNFAKRKLGKKGLALGKAILVYVKNPFENASFSFRTIDLQGHGVRGMEYVPGLNGLVIIGGPTFKANGYSLWLYKDNGVLEKLKIKWFEKLCRPEAVISINEKGVDYLIILSEESGKACNDSKFNYIKSKIKVMEKSI
jgi:hypothetical protein